MKLPTYLGLGFVTIVLLMQRWDYSVLGLFILGTSFCIPEILGIIKQKKWRNTGWTYR